MDRTAANEVDGPARQGRVAGLLGAVVWSVPLHAAKSRALADQIQEQWSRYSARDEVLWTRGIEAADAARGAGIPAVLSETPGAAVWFPRLGRKHRRIQLRRVFDPDLVPDRSPGQAALHLVRRQ